MKRIFFFMIALIVIIITHGNAEYQSQKRSSSLQMILTEDGNEQRIDYVDENGIITYAADKHYATLIKTRFDSYMLEKFFDEKGQPAKQSIGYYAIFREFDSENRNFKITFLDINGNPLITSHGYAIIIQSFYENGNIKAEHYYDIDGIPINTNAYGYGCYKEYNSKNRNVYLEYLGNNGEPMITAQGFAISRKEYYEDGPDIGKVKREFYYSEDGEPIMLFHGQFGVYKEYDEFGRDYLLTYLDANGNQIITREGYTIIKRTYYEDDSIKTEMYFDMDGNPARLSGGQYGLLYKDGKIYYLDINGEKKLNLKQLFYNSEILTLVISVIAVFISVIVSRKINNVLLVLYLFAIVYMTLLYRNKNVAVINYDLSNFLKFFSDSNIRRGLINNTLLFIPLGTILFCLYPNRVVFIIPIVISIAIEIIQYYAQIGYCELIDVISNSLGGIIGYYVGKLLYAFRSSLLTKREIKRWE